jgi:hypothetical protein
VHERGHERSDPRARPPELADRRAAGAVPLGPPATGRQPPNTLAAARRRALEQAVITGHVAPDRLFDLLRADDDWLRDAMSAEQRAVVERRDPSRPTDVA